MTSITDVLDVSCSEEAWIIVCKLARHKLECLIQEYNRDGDLHHSHPLLDIQWCDLEDYRHDIHIEDEEMQEHRKTDSSDQP
uniref:Uncharacterized protein n=1 Tax=Arion vulgaris TaxID=1028688 RepID=A0A0B7AFZ0_9EUPU